MIAKVVRVDAEGWWVLRPRDRAYDEIKLPTFALPKDVRYPDDIHLERIGEGWKVTKIVKRLRSKYGRHHLR